MPEAEQKPSPVQLDKLVASASLSSSIALDYHLPFAMLILLLEQVVDDLILCLDLVSIIFLCIFEHLLDVLGK